MEKAIAFSEWSLYADPWLDGKDFFLSPMTCAKVALKRIEKALVEWNMGTDDSSSNQDVSFFPEVRKTTLAA